MEHSEQPKRKNTPLDELCLAMTHIANAALGLKIIDQDDYDLMHRAIWQTCLKQTPRKCEEKTAPELVET